MKWEHDRLDDNELNTLYPTHKCFDDMLMYISESLQAGLDPHTVLLVHGLCLMPSGALYAHAWAAHPYIGGIGGECVSSHLFRGEECFVRFPRVVFMKRFNPVEETIYTMPDVAREHRRTRNAGPWNTEYLPYCSTSRKRELVHA